MKVLFLVNPSAGGRGSPAAVEVAKNTFAGAGWDVTTVRTKSTDQAADSIRTATDKGYELLILAGGDGTLSHAVQHLPLAEPGGVSPLPFGIFPLGSGNDFFRGTGAPRDPKGAAENLVNGKAHPIDVGLVVPIHDDGTVRDEQPERFLNTVGVGMDSQTLATREKSPAWMSARYELLFLMTLMRLYPLEVRLETDDWSRNVDAYWILCCNNGYIGSGMHVAPDAKIDDGLLDVLIIEKMSKLRFIMYLPRIFKGTHCEIDGIDIHRAKNIVLKCNPVQRMAVDGDRAFESPARISILPGAASLHTSKSVENS